MTKAKTEISLFDGSILRRAAGQAVLKLDPRGLMRNPVIFVTALTALLVTVLVIRDAATGASSLAIGIQVALWLWFTVLFATSPRRSPRAGARRAPTPSAPRAPPPGPGC